MEGDLLDWELVHGSDVESTDSITSENKSGSSSVINDGMILSDHFSADNIVNLPGEITDQSLGSGDSSRVDYGSESPNRVQNPVDLGFDQLNVYQSGVRNELGLIDGEISGDGEVVVSDFEAGDDKNIEGEAVSDESHIEDASKYSSESNNESKSVVEETVEDLSISWSDSGGNQLVSADRRIVNGQEEEIKSDSGVVSSESNEGTLEVVAVSSGDESKNRETVWWKMPFVLAKYYAFRIGPVWSVSMAAAVVGFVLLGRRLYNMKKKAQRFHLKVAIDDKKVSRVMNQAARLNEMFTEVRRVPVIRPALPSPGAWPVLSLR